MTLEQLRIFVAVAERNHVTRAAQDLGITQSAASANIAALEARYQTRLFSRVGRGIELTDAGRRFLPEARAVLASVDKARSALIDLSGVISGTVAVSASQTIASYWLPRRLTTYHVAYPQVQLELSIGNTQEVESAVVEGAADLGLVEGPTRHASLDRVRLDRDQPLLVLPADRSAPTMAGSDKIDLKAMTWIVREVGSGTRGILEELVEKEGLTLDDLNIALVLPDNESVREAVLAGAGATVISEHVVGAAIKTGDLKAIPIDLPPREFALIRRRDRHPGAALRALLDDLVNQADVGVVSR